MFPVFPVFRVIGLSLFLLTIFPLTAWADKPVDERDPNFQSVAVWDFENATVPGMGDRAATQYLARAIPEMIIAKLVDVPDLIIVERIQLREVMEELKLGSSELADPKSQLRLGKISGAKFMIFGNFMVIGSVVQVTMRVVNVETSLMTFADDNNGDMNTIPAMIETLSTNIANSFAAGDRSKTHFAGQQNVEIWKRQERGLALIDQRQYGKAVKIFQGILKDHPGFRPAKRQIQMAQIGDTYRNGLEFMKGGNYKKAVNTFKKILKQNPGFKPARQNLKKALKLKRQAE